MKRSEQVKEEAVRVAMLSEARWSVIRRDHPDGVAQENRARRAALHALADEDCPLVPGDPLLTLHWATFMLQEATALDEALAP